MKKFCLALDLVDDAASIEAYEHWHKNENMRPGIKQSILDSGITSMEIYRTGNRLFMIIEAADDFSFETKSAMDAADPKVQEWEQFVSQFQQPIPWARKGEKWVLMDKIFTL